MFLSVREFEDNEKNFYALKDDRSNNVQVGSSVDVNRIGDAGDEMRRPTLSLDSCKAFLLVDK